MMELQADFAQWKAGTILLAGNSIPKDLSKTQLDLYISTDKGYVVFRAFTKKL
jgi:hypothetical protein